MERKFCMIGFCVRVTGLKISKLKKLVGQHMLSPRQIVLAVKKEKRMFIPFAGKNVQIPLVCSECQATLSDVAGCYKKIPTEDLTLRFEVIHDDPYVVQWASGGGDCRVMKEAVRIVVQRHIMQKLKKFGIQCSSKLI